MTLKLSSRHEWVTKSELRAMSVECERVGGVNLAQGVCDLALPEPVRLAAKAAIDAGHNSYSRHDGCGELRRAIAAKYQRRAGLDDEYFDKLAAKYRQKRELICTALDDAGLTPCVPQGAYYVLADVSSLPGTDSKARSMYLLDKTGVASVPGQSFFSGPEGEGIARFCFAKEDDVIEDACSRLRALAN